MTEFFDLSFRFYPTDLAKSDETTPIIRWWSSTIRDYRRGVVDSEPILEWEEFTKQRSSNGEGGEENDSEGISTKPDKTMLNLKDNTVAISPKIGPPAICPTELA